MSADKDNLNAMMCLDIYLSSLSDEEYVKVIPTIRARRVLPLLSWDISANATSKIIADAKTDDRDKLGQLSVKHLWRIDIDSLLDKDYEALVVTDIDRKICWVNSGFTAMTGYSSNYAIGRTPGFLQGKNTSYETRKKIGKRLKERKPYIGRIINYRKNKEEYVCDVRIIPIYNFNDEVTHFIAFEREAV